MRAAGNDAKRSDSSTHLMISHCACRVNIGDCELTVNVGEFVSVSLRSDLKMILLGISSVVQIALGAPHVRVRTPERDRIDALDSCAEFDVPNSSVIPGVEK